jgi:ligand-binding sensor domain-containing protein
MNPRGLGWESVLHRSPSTLNDRNVSALAVDAHGNLWVGYFNRGLDRLDASGGQVTHVENEHVFCVNRILPEEKSGLVDVATANGLVRFSATGRVEQVLTRSSGLIADHVTDVAAHGDGLVLATPAGLTLLDFRGARSLYAFQGLVNNHAYALAVSGDEMVVGTLGGISVVHGEIPQANYTVANSALRHNWITAVVPVGDEWMVGTYGAGVMSLDQEHRFHALEGATGPYNVNPNAMLVTPTRVFVGTMGNGLGVYDRGSGRWMELRDGLPSSNVTALAAGGGYLYIGTDNGLVRIEENRLQP